MLECLNEDPVIEYNIEISNNFTSCIYCGIKNQNVLVQCGECNHKFCNGKSEFLSCCHILSHMKRSSHKSIKIEKKKLNEELYFDDNTIEIISCGYCQVSNIFDLYFYKDIQKKKIEFLCQLHFDKKINTAKEEEKKLIKEKFKKIVYEIKNDNESNNNKKSNIYSCINYELIEEPDNIEDIMLLNDCLKETVIKNEEIIQLTDPITQRFLNKVKDRYDSSDEYYEIYKPLIFSEYKYVKNIFESKPEYPIELYYSKNEKEKDGYLYFIISNKFNGINFNIGKRIQFNEEPKIIEDLFYISEDYEGNNRGQPIWFTGVVFDIIPNKREFNKKIIILPIDRSIDDIMYNLGTYYMKENFCDIPYIRMLKGLDTFIRNKENNTSNLIFTQILGIIDKEEIKKIDEKEMKELFNEKELITKIDNYGELNTQQTKCMKKVFTNSLNMIQGPPGTGKTFLASFIIYNIFQKRKDAQDKILVCAPSNSAADNLALCLLKLNNSLNIINENENNNEKENKIHNNININNEKNNNVLKGQMRLLRIYPKVKELLEVNKSLTDISLHKILKSAIEEYNQMKINMNNNNKDEYSEESMFGYFDNINSMTNENIFPYTYQNLNSFHTLNSNSFNSLLEEKSQVTNENKKSESINIKNNPKKIQNITNNIINEHDIIITTCSTTFDTKLKNSDFKYVLIDESTQCCEIECLLPIVHGSRHVILIGDQKQLGPTIIYPKANSVGMKISLFERMIKIYPDNFIMLKKQYRMNPELSKFSSDFFYNGLIKNSSKHKETKYSKKIIKKFFWPKKGIPIMFINTNNKSNIKYNLTDVNKIIKKKLNNNNNYFTSERDVGKSYENELEADITVKIINMFNSIKSYKKGKYNIGVITPYIGQKKLILEKLSYSNNNNKEDFDYFNNNIINIASVDSFQGKEKDFIIINTVRSNYKNNIGFLKDPRRLNVSLTRAKYGLIIIGDAICLSNSIGERDNKYNVWRYLINKYQELGVIVDYNEGQKDEKMFSKVQILKNEEKLEDYKFQEYEYDGKYNIPKVNMDYIDNFDYKIKKNFVNYIDDREFCKNNDLFYNEDDYFDDFQDEFYDDFYDYNEDIYDNNNYDYYPKDDYYYNDNHNNKNFKNQNRDYIKNYNYNRNFNEEICKNNDDYYNNNYKYNNYNYNKNYIKDFNNNYQSNNHFYNNDNYYKRKDNRINDY